MWATAVPEGRRCDGPAHQRASGGRWASSCSGRPRRGPSPGGGTPRWPRGTRTACPCWCSTGSSPAAAGSHHLNIEAKLYFRKWAVLRIHEILVRIRMRNRIWGSIPLPNGSNPAIFDSKLQNVSKKFFLKFFCFLLFWRYIYIIFQR
jgi:hypothetical protein